MNSYRWEELAAGMSAEFIVTITPELMHKFCEISGDTNPLHLSEEFASAQGFRGRVAYGLLTSAFYSQLIGVYLPGKFAVLHGIDVDFRSPAYIGDTLKVQGQVSHLNDAYHRLEVKATITNQENRVISKATIRAGVRAA